MEWADMARQNEDFNLAKSVDNLLTSDPQILNILKKIPNFNKSNHIEIVENCQKLKELGQSDENLTIPGFYNGSSIMLCRDNIIACNFLTKNLNSLLRHELVHFYDEKVLKKDLAKEFDLKVSELRAYKYSGFCNFKSRVSRLSLESENECLNLMTINSLSHVIKGFKKGDEKFRDLKEELGEILRDPKLMADLEFDNVES